MFTKAKRFKAIASGNFLVANFSSLSLFFVQNFSFLQNLMIPFPSETFCPNKQIFIRRRESQSCSRTRLSKNEKFEFAAILFRFDFFRAEVFFCRNRPNCRNYFEPSMRTSSSSSSWWTQSGWVCSSCTLSSFAASWTSGGRLPQRPRLRLSLFRLGSRGRTPSRRASSSCRQNTSRRDSPTTSRTVW